MNTGEVFTLQEVILLTFLSKNENQEVVSRSFHDPMAKLERQVCYFLIANGSLQLSYVYM